jgi:hypothetical protein
MEGRDVGCLVHGQHDEHGDAKELDCWERRRAEKISGEPGEFIVYGIRIGELGAAA